MMSDDVGGVEAKTFRKTLVFATQICGMASTALYLGGTVVTIYESNEQSRLFPTGYKNRASFQPARSQAKCALLHKAAFFTTREYCYAG